MIVAVFKHSRNGPLAAVPPAVCAADIPPAVDNSSDPATADPAFRNPRRESPERIVALQLISFLISPSQPLGRPSSGLLYRPKIEI
jgi:hypothetical protein